MGIFDLSMVVVVAACILYIMYRRHAGTRHRRNIRRARQLLKKLRHFQGRYANQRMLTYLRQIDPFVFEELVLTCFADAGCKIMRNKRYTGDGGIDGRVMVDGTLCLVQCKRYRNHINRQDVAAFNELVVQHGARLGYFVHTGRTGRAVKEARYANVRMISGKRLLMLVQGIFPFEK